MTDRARAKHLSEHVQKIRLADVELEKFAFLLLTGIDKIVEDQNEANIAWSFNPHSLALSISNIGLSDVITLEANAAAAKLSALHNFAQTSNTEELFVLRAKAAVDRALGLAHRFCTTVAKVYKNRATTFVHALAVDRHGVSVFAEDEIRAKATIQASRIALALCCLTRKVLDLPPWNPLCNGCAFGRVVFPEKLGDVMNIDVDVIAMCRQADGDEDIHLCVREAILERLLAHLSNQGVRARQNGVVFVYAEDQDSFEVV
ncbi:Phosphoglucan water dikinase PWD [Gracilaria domingensis]|nr:Phosphoglucan water dikinase PWD [Gracilaria domingensis]